LRKSAHRYLEISPGEQPSRALFNYLQGCRRLQLPESLVVFPLLATYVEAKVAVTAMRSEPTEKTTLEQFIRRLVD
jgi:hypothetical protein